MTIVGTVGTRNYQSPEMHLGKPYGQKTDIWSAGCILFELITLKVLFDVVKQSDNHILIRERMKVFSYSDEISKLETIPHLKEILRM